MEVTSVLQLSLSLTDLVLPQHPVAVPRCKVSAVWTDTDGPDACPVFRCLTIPWFVCMHICDTFWIQQGTGVSIYIDRIQEILESNDEGRHIIGRICTCIFRNMVFDAKLTLLRIFWEWTWVGAPSSVRHILIVLSAEQVRNVPDDRPATDSPGTSGNIWRGTAEGGSGNY